MIEKLYVLNKTHPLGNVIITYKENGSEKYIKIPATRLPVEILFCESLDFSQDFRTHLLKGTLVLISEGEANV